MDSKSDDAAPVPFVWNKDNITRFWNLVGHSPLDRLSFSLLLGNELVRFVKKNVPPGKRLLDYGGGSGHLAKLLSNEGYDVGIFEPSAERYREITASAAAEDGKRPAVFAKMNGEKFDGVICFEVLEHVLDAELPDAFKTLAVMTGEKGILVGSVPMNENLLDDMCVCPACETLFHRWQHQRSFSAESIESELKKSGFAWVQYELHYPTRHIFFAAGNAAIPMNDNLVFSGVKNRSIAAPSGYLTREEFVDELCDRIDFREAYAIFKRKAKQRFGYGIPPQKRQLPEKQDKGSIAFNFQPLDAKARNIGEDVKYAISIADKYLADLGGVNSGDLTGKRILEIGPGINFGTVLTLQGFGASEVHVVDKYLCPYQEAYHDEFYRSLLGAVADKYPSRRFPVLEQCIAAKSYSVKGLFLHNNGLESLSDFGDGSIDIVLSNAVLEHIEKPPVCFAELTRITAQAGIGIHQVDFRDHRDYARPLEFLLLGDSAREDLLSSCHCECGNTWRPDQYAQLFMKNGFNLISLTHNIFAEDHYLDHFMEYLVTTGSPYRNYSRDDLKPVSSLFIVKKGRV